MKDCCKEADEPRKKKISVKKIFSYALWAILLSIILFAVFEQFKK